MEFKVLLDQDEALRPVCGDKSPKIDVNTMNVFVEWCDQVFYLKKDANGDRYLVLDSDMVALAKNRLGMSGEVKLSDIDINELLTPRKDK